MVQFTLFELHVDDVEFGDAPFARSPASGTVEPTEDDAGSDDEGGSGIASKLVGVLVIAAAAYAARRFLGGGSEEPEFAAEESVDPLAAD